MFLANEDVALRQHKRRIIEYVEETINDDVLDRGTTVMVMQVACRAPGCVPLETLVVIVFPRVSGNYQELLPGLPVSAVGGTYKTKLLMPMMQVNKEDVLDALPPAFQGGRRSMETLCLQARDVMLAQVTQIMGDDDLEGKKLMARYLIESLNEYIERGCVAPEYGKEYASVEAKDGESVQEEKTIIQGTGNVVIRRKVEDPGK
jgi:hypothetical protein